MSFLSEHLNFERVPRKFKKAYLGRRLSRSKLRKMLANVQIIPATNGHDMATILPKEFCPKCGCEQVRMHSHDGVWYPERWVSGYCMRCNFHVLESDNSPYFHCLELKEYNYVI